MTIGEVSRNQLLGSQKLLIQIFKDSVNEQHNSVKHGNQLISCNEKDYSANQYFFKN